MAAHVSVEFLKATPSIIDRSTCILRNNVFPLLFSFLYVCICASVILLTCNLFLSNADVKWLPGSARPFGQFQSASTLILLLIFPLLARVSTNKHCCCWCFC